MFGLRGGGRIGGRLAGQMIVAKNHDGDLRCALHLRLRKVLMRASLSRLIPWKVARVAIEC